jgi:long-chain acyl-CoA synthetase
LKSEDLMRFCRERLEAYQMPESIEIVDELPRTALGKVSRRIVRERLEDQALQSRRA